jgi:diaminopimelate decarboxylase
LREAVRLDVASINIDDLREIELLRKVTAELGRKARVSLRLKVDPASHFGLAIPSGEAGSAADAIAKHGDAFEFVGLHFHGLADNDDPSPHIAYLRQALDFAKHIKTRYALRTTHLNVGGGYTVPTMKVMSRLEYARQRLLETPARPPDPDSGIGIESYMKSLAKALTAYCKVNDMATPRLIFEPGRIITSQSHVLLTSVHAIKANTLGPDFAMTDAGKILTSYPCDYEYHQMFVANRMRSACEATYHLMGRLCTSADWLAKHRCLPALQSGDVIAIMDAGAYFTSYASNFAYPRPAIVMLDAGDTRTLRLQETFQHLTAMDRLPATDSTIATRNAPG